MTDLQQKKLDELRRQKGIISNTPSKLEKLDALRQEKGVPLPSRETKNENSAVPSVLRSGGAFDPVMQAHERIQRFMDPNYDEKNPLERMQEFAAKKQAEEKGTPAELDRIQSNLEKAKAERSQLHKQARTAFAVGGSGAVTNQRQVQDLDGRIEQLEADYNRALNDYYTRSNTEAIEKAGTAYTEYQGLVDDIATVNMLIEKVSNELPDAEYRKGVADIGQRYNLGKMSIIGDVRPLEELRNTLEQRRRESEEKLTSAGYDPKRMAGFTERERAVEAEQKNIEGYEQFAAEHPVLASAASVVMTPAKTIDALKAGYKGLVSDSEDYENYVPMSTADFTYTNFVDGVRKQVSKEVEEKTDWQLWGTNAASFLYNTGMSIADSAAMIALFGGGATYLLGGSAAASTSAEIVQRGGTNEQAFWGGLAAGAAEGFFERFSVERLLKAPNADGIKGALKAAGIQAMTEASEEMGTEVSNIIMDAAIMGRLSNYQTAIDEYVSTGMSREEAERRVLIECIGQVALAGLGGALSGGVMSGGTQTIRGGTQLAGEKLQQLRENAETRQTAKGIDDAYAAMREHGLFSGEAAAAARRAGNQVQQRRDNEAQRYNAENAGRISERDAHIIETILQDIGEPEEIGPRETEMPADTQQATDIETEVLTDEREENAGRTEQSDRAGGQRDAGEYTPGKAGVLGERTAGSERREIQARQAAERKNSVNDLGLPKVSTRQLGFKNGADYEDVTVIPESAYDSELSSISAAMAERGLNTVFFCGDLAVYSHDRLCSARGAYLNGTVYVKADHDIVTASQIADHESFHAVAEADRDIVLQIRDHILNEMSREELVAMIDKYQAAYHMEDSDGTEDAEILEEIFADAYAGMNSYGARAEKLQGTVWEVLSQRDTRETEQLQEPARGPPEADAGEPMQQGKYGAALADDPYIRHIGRALRDGTITEDEYDELYDQHERSRGYGRELGEDLQEEAARWSIDERTITPGMSDDERYEILKDKKISVPHFEETKMASVEDGDYEALERIGRGEAFKILRKIGEQFGVFKDYRNEDVDIEFGFSRRNLQESLNKQNGEYKNYARMMSVFDQVVENAIGIEAHGNRYRDRGTSVKNTYVFASAFATDTGLVPVLLEVREFTDGRKNSLYIAVSLQEIERSRIVVYTSADVSEGELYTLPASGSRIVGYTSADVSEGELYPLPASTINIADLLSNVNEADGRMLKYIPDDFLNEVQLAAKEQAMKEQEEYIRRKDEAWRAKHGISESGEKHPLSHVNAELSGEGRFSMEESPERTALPKKAKEALRRSENRLIGRMSKALSVPKFAQREFLQEAVQRMSNEYLRSGRISDQTIDELFEETYQQGVIADNAFYQENKELKEHLRSYPITISERDKSDIVGYDGFLKSARGTLRIVNEGGVPVDVAYQELSESYGNMFPKHITHPADQLLRMCEVGKSIQIVEKSLSEFYGKEAGEFKRWAKNDYLGGVYDAMAELRNVVRYAENRNAEEERITVPETVEEVKALWKDIKDARRAYEKENAKHLLTDFDRIQVGRLLRGEILPEYLPQGTNIRGVRAVYEAKKRYDEMANAIKAWNKQRRSQLREQADTLLADAIHWKDKKAGTLYSRETMERNIRDIVSDAGTAAEIIKTYIKPVHDNEAKSTKLKNYYRDRVRALDLSQKVAQSNEVSESYAVQLLGEALDSIEMLENSKGRLKERDGKSLTDWRAIVEDIWLKNPNLDKAKIEGAIEEFRKIYNELFEQMNEVRIRNGYEPINYRRGYFPHFQEDKPEGLLGLMGKALGIETEVAELPTTINGMTHTFRPGIRWTSSAQERKGFHTTYDALQGFDRYIEGTADVIFHTDDIQRLRALAAQIRYRTGDEGIRAQIDKIDANPNMSEEDKRRAKEEIYESGRYTLSNFVVELEEYTNLLANKKPFADRNMEREIGRRGYNILKALESRVAANMVAVNPGSWLTNFIPITQAWAAVDTGSIMRGMWQTLRSYKESDGILEMSSFLTNRQGSDPLVRTPAQQVGEILSRPMSYIDSFTAGAIVRARYLQNLQQGMSEQNAIEDADAFAAAVMADRSKGSMPTVFARRNPLTKLFTQFQLEVNNQFSYLFKDVPDEIKERGLAALAAALLKFFFGAWLYNEVYEHFIGRRPALDPFGILNDTVGDLTGYELPNMLDAAGDIFSGEMPDFTTERVGGYDAAANAATAAAEELPFIGGLLGGGRIPISSALPDWANLGKAALNSEWAPEKRLSTAAKELANPLTYLALPFGGGQMKKIYQGIKATAKRGKYSVDAAGNELLQYPMYADSPLDLADSLLTGMTFGVTATEEGREWIENGFKSLSADETAVYQRLIDDFDVTDREAYSLITELKGIEKTFFHSAAELKRRALAEAEISDEAKSAVYYGLYANDTELELLDNLADNDADMGAAYRVISGIREAENTYEKREQLIDAPLSDNQKLLIYHGLVAGTDESYLKDVNMFRDFEAAGLNMDDALEAKNIKYLLDQDESKKAADRAKEFGRWVSQQDYTSAQEQLVKDNFKFFTMTPASAGAYEKMQSVGLSEEDAYDLDSALDALKPADGKSTVSSLQKSREVVNMGMSNRETLAALSVVMSDSDYSKATVANDYGVMPAVYVSYREAQLEADDGSGAISQDEAKAAIDSLLGLTTEQRATLWQLTNKTWKAEKNPYSREVGARVKAALG